MREFFNLLVKEYGDCTSMSYDPTIDRIEVRCAGSAEVMANIYQTALKEDKLVGLTIRLR